MPPAVGELTGLVRPDWRSRCSPTGQGFVTVFKVLLFFSPLTVTLLLSFIRENRCRNAPFYVIPRKHRSFSDLCCCLHFSLSLSLCLARRVLYLPITARQRPNSLQSLPSLCSSNSALLLPHSSICHSPHPLYGLPVSTSSPPSPTAPLIRLPGSPINGVSASRRRPLLQILSLCRPLTPIRPDLFS